LALQLRSAGRGGQGRFRLGPVKVGHSRRSRLKKTVKADPLRPKPFEKREHFEKRKPFGAAKAGFGRNADRPGQGAGARPAWKRDDRAGQDSGGRPPQRFGAGPGARQSGVPGQRAVDRSARSQAVGRSDRASSFWGQVIWRQTRREAYFRGEAGVWQTIHGKSRRLAAALERNPEAEPLATSREAEASERSLPTAASVTRPRVAAAHLVRNQLGRSRETGPRAFWCKAGVEETRRQTFRQFWPQGWAAVIDRRSSGHYAATSGCARGSRSR